MGLLNRIVSRIAPDPASFGEVEGTPARAIIVEKRGMGIQERGLRTSNIRLDLVLRLVGDTETQTVDVHTYVSPLAARVAGDGLEVPVRVDPSTGALAGLDRRAWEEEAAVLDAEYKVGTRQRRKQPTAADVLAIDAADPILEPIAGVDLDTWLQVEVGLHADGIPADGHEAYAVAHGVAPGAWPEASTGWTKRSRKDFRVATRLGAAHAAAAEQR